MSFSQPSFKEQHLDINGFQDQPVAHTFFKQNDSTDRLAIILPGAGYSARMPLLYYTVLSFLEAGADVITVDYDYTSAAARSAIDFQPKLTENVLAAIKKVLDQRPYQHVTLIGKSVGTRAMSWVLSNKNHPFVSIPDFKTVWLTPVWTDDKVFPLMMGWQGPALHIIGTSDRPFYDNERHQKIERLDNATVLAIPNADHSLDIHGDLKGSVQAIHTAIEAIHKFTT